MGLAGSQAGKTKRQVLDLPFLLNPASGLLWPIKTVSRRYAPPDRRFLLQSLWRRDIPP